MILHTLLEIGQNVTTQLVIYNYLWTFLQLFFVLVYNYTTSSLQFGFHPSM